MEGARAANTPGEELIIDYKLIPSHARDELAATILDSVRAFIQQPGGREILEARKLAKKEGSLKSCKVKGAKNDESGKIIAGVSN